MRVRVPDVAQLAARPDRRPALHGVRRAGAGPGVRRRGRRPDRGGGVKRVIDRWKWACTVAAPALNGSQRAALNVLAAHAPEGITIVGRATIAESLGVSERSVAAVLQSLEVVGVISLEYRPGKPTITTVNYGWTRELDFPGQRPRQGVGGKPEPGNSASRVDRPDPGTSRELVGNSSSPERSKGVKKPLSLPTEARDVGEGAVIDITKTARLEPLHGAEGGVVSDHLAITDARATAARRHHPAHRNRRARPRRHPPSHQAPPGRGPARRPHPPTRPRDQGAHLMLAPAQPPSAVADQPGRHARPHLPLAA